MGSDSALFLDSVVIGHADNMHENPNNWTLSISKEGGEEVFSKTTSLMGAGDKELVEFKFNGEFGQNYILKFADNGSDHPRGAIDNLKFGQLGKNDMFTLDTNGTLKTATTFDYESNASSYTITVQAKDELNATTEGNFTVVLNNVWRMQIIMTAWRINLNV